MTKSSTTRTHRSADKSDGLLSVGLGLAIEYCATEALRSYSRNARTHSDRQIEQIAESIRAFGFISPIVADRSGELIAGHGRLAAAKLIGLHSVPVVRVEHLNDAQKRALRLADNKLAELAGWDEKLLRLEFKDLVEFDLKLDLNFDLGITGFASAEIDKLVGSGEDIGCDAEDDIIPTVDHRAPNVSRLGDLWQLDQHRLICGDSREANVYETLLGTEKAAMGIHDSPYAVSITRHVSRSGKHPEFVMGVGEMSDDEFISFLTSFLRHSSNYSRPGSIQWAFMDWRHAHEMLTAGRRAELELKNIAVWNKGVGAMGSLLRSQHELVFMFKEPSGPHINNVELGKYGRTRTNVWDYPGAVALRKELELHPTPKPVALVADAIRDVSNRNDLVLDAFCGSGTTIIAAAKTGRRARTIELDPRYVDTAIKRWEKWSGQQALHIASGLTFADLAKERSSSSPPISPPALARRWRTRPQRIAG